MDCSLPVFSACGIFQEQCWSWSPFPTLGHIPDPGIKFASLVSSAFAGNFFTTDAPVKPQMASLLLVPLGKATEWIRYTLSSLFMDCTFVCLFNTKKVQNSRKLESPEVGMFPDEVKVTPAFLFQFLCCKWEPFLQYSAT